MKRAARAVLWALLEWLAGAGPRGPTPSSAGGWAEVPAGPAVKAFLSGDSVRQVAYFAAHLDPVVGQVPAEDWPGQVHAVEGELRRYILGLRDRVAELENEIADLDKQLEDSHVGGN